MSDEPKGISLEDAMRDMAESTPPEVLVKAFNKVIGESNAENMSLRRKLARQTERADAAERALHAEKRAYARLERDHAVTVDAMCAYRDERTIAQERLTTAEQQAARLRAALQAVMRRIDRSGNACWCPPIFDDRMFHTSDCLQARVALAVAAPAAETERGGEGV